MTPPPPAPPPVPEATSRWLGPRIWRAGRGDFHNDETLAAPQIYCDQTLNDLASHGFDGFWIRGKLTDLMVSAVFPELNSDQAPQRLAALRATAQRAARRGMGLHLYFNEPLALPADHPFWPAHPELRGQSHTDFGETTPRHALCTSTPQVRAFLRQAITSIARNIPDLAGVILITASEHHTHCYSHHAAIPLNDGITENLSPPTMTCPRCSARSPADVVLELLEIWEQSIHAVSPRCHVVAWNWSWSMWYPDPQQPIVDHLPQGVCLMADFERGGHRPWRGTTLPVDEYSLAYPGPSERFTGSSALARKRHIPVWAKLQIGTTHEIATVPNLPLIQNLHRKFVGLVDQQVAGALCVWNFGCHLTLNTFALKLFADHPDTYRNADRFLPDLVTQYFAVRDTHAVVSAWALFCRAFEHHPFSLPFLYFGPMNHAPACPLSSEYSGRPLKGSWIDAPDFGDRHHDAIVPPFTLPLVVDALRDMADLWQQGVVLYGQALSGDAHTDPAIRLHRAQELSCARMIGIQLRSTLHLLAFQDWRLRRMEEMGLQPPCSLPLDEHAVDLIRREITNITPAVALTQADPRLGHHQEAQAYFYHSAMIAAKLDDLRQLIAGR